MERESGFLSDAARQSVLADLRRDEGVRLALPDGSRLVFDRPVPFLCVYRRPQPEPDPATESLITSQSAYLLLAPEADMAAANALLADIADAMVERFDGFLLLEFWLRPVEAGERPPHVFRIVAPGQNPPTPVLEEMEEALLACTIHRRTPKVCVDYVDTVRTSDGKAFAPCRPGQTGVTCLGLEVSPVYRDPHSDEVYVFALEAFRRRLNTALKRTFHAFAHRYTRYRPAHYHEMGPRRPDTEALRVDRGLARISAGFDLLLHVTPVNADAAWEEFRQHRYARAPTFLYRPRTIAPGLAKRRLFRLPLERIEDPTLARILQAKRDELDRQITLVADRNTPRFLPGSRALFGDVEPELGALAGELLSSIDHDGRSGGDMLDAEAFARRAREELRHYRQQDRRFRSGVEVRDDIAGIMVSHGRFLIGRGARVAASRVGAALAHEIGTHVVTWYNGRLQPFRELQEGMAGYEPMQEGLAVLAEYLVGELEASRLRQLAGRVRAVELITDGADFVETFRVLHNEYGFAPRGAFMMTMRTFRGGGYTKDAVYLRGLRRLLQRLANGVKLEDLYVGKVADAWLPYVEELRWRSIVQPPAVLPRFFTLPGTDARRRRLAEGLTVMQLLEAA